MGELGYVVDHVGTTGVFTDTPTRTRRPCTLGVWMSSVVLPCRNPR